MAIDIPSIHGGRSLILDGLAQSNIDMDHHQLINLDTSNLSDLGSPPTVIPPANNWLKSWNNSTNTWTHQQVNFINLAGNLTLGVGGQQRAITQLGTIGVGTWNASIITGPYLARLNEIRFPTGPTNIGFQRLINLADPVEPFDAVTKRFMDFLLQGLNVHEAVRVATTTRIPASGLPVVDGVQLVSGNRVLIKNVNPGEEAYAGLWIARSGVWEVAPDYLTVEDETRTYVAVREGTLNENTSWVQVLPITSITDPKKFVYFTIAGGEQGPPGEDGAGVPPGGEADQILAKKTGADFDTEWVDPVEIALPNFAILQTFQINNIPGTTSATGRMMGLGSTAHGNCVITPTASGKVVITVAGFTFNTGSAGAVAGQMVIGPGLHGPNNGAVQPAGSFLVGAAIGRSAMGASVAVPFSVTCAAYGLTVGNPIWIDIMLQSLPGGTGQTATIAGVSVSAYEIP
jgi:hypothetical protein